MGKDWEPLPDGKGERKRHLSNVGFLNYTPHHHHQSAGLLCPEAMCCFQWDSVVSLEDGGVREWFQQNRFQWDAKFRRVR